MLELIKKYRPLLLYLLIPLAAGGLSAFLTRNSMDVYERIVLPPFAPPGWIFPVTWTVLYVLMGYGSWLCRYADAKRRKPALVLYWTQLTLNFLWPLLFFNMEQWFLSFLLLLVLLCTVLLMSRAFYRCQAKAGYLQIPYCLWLIFAAYLNWMIFLRN